MPIERVRPDGARIQQIVSELTGRNVGVKIEHKDGRVSGIAMPPTVEKGFAETIPVSMSEFQKIQYNRLRSQGYSREAALLLTSNH